MTTDRTNRPPEPATDRPPDDARVDEASTETDTQSVSGGKDAGQATPVNAKSTHQGIAARGYSWPPFEDGNTAGVKAGTRSPKTFAAVAAEITAQVRTWLAENEPALKDHLAEHSARAEDDVFEMARQNLVAQRAVAWVALARALNGSATTRDIETANAALRGEREALRELGLTVPSWTAVAAGEAATEHTLADLAERGAQVLAVIEGEAVDEDGDE